MSPAEKLQDQLADKQEIISNAYNQELIKKQEHDALMLEIEKQHQDKLIALDPGFEALHKIHSARRYRAVGDLQTANAAHECMLTLHHPVLLGTTADIEEIALAIHKVKTHATALQTQQ